LFIFQLVPSGMSFTDHLIDTGFREQAAASRLQLVMVRWYGVDFEGERAAVIGDRALG
jgi:hypothetical protein